MFEKTHQRQPGLVLDTNDSWVEALRGPDRDEAIGRLREVLVRGLRIVLAQRAPKIAESLAEDFAQEALLKILNSLDTFRGESRFTTWAQKIAVRVAFTELRRKRWQNISLDGLMPEMDPSAGRAALVLSDPDRNPEETANQRLLLEQVRRIMQEELSERQRKAMTAVMMHGMPLEEVARRLGTNRNALYKLLHDARKRLKRELERRGFVLDEILATL